MWRDLSRPKRFTPLKQTSPEIWRHSRPLFLVWEIHPCWRNPTNSASVEDLGRASCRHNALPECRLDAWTYWSKITVTRLFVIPEKGFILAPTGKASLAFRSADSGRWKPKVHTAVNIGTLSRPNRICIYRKTLWQLWTSFSKGCILAVFVRIIESGLKNSSHFQFEALVLGFHTNLRKRVLAILPELGPNLDSHLRKKFYSQFPARGLDLQPEVLLQAFE